jgi:hypothetical protein
MYPVWVVGASVLTMRIPRPACLSISDGWSGDVDASIKHLIPWSRAGVEIVYLFSIWSCIIEVFIPATWAGDLDDHLVWFSWGVLVVPNGSKGLGVPALKECIPRCLCSGYSVDCCGCSLDLFVGAVVLIGTLTTDIPSLVLLFCMWFCSPNWQRVQFAVERKAAIAWCTCHVIHVFLPNLWSFLTFQRYHKVVKIHCIKESSTLSEITNGRITYTPSSSIGRLSVRSGGVAENQTARAKSQWKNKWASVSSIPQYVQCSSMCWENLEALDPVASALRIRRQAKVLMRGGSVFSFQVRWRIWLAWVGCFGIRLLLLAVEPGPVTLEFYICFWWCSHLS